MEVTRRTRSVGKERRKEMGRGKGEGTEKFWMRRIWEEIGREMKKGRREEEGERREEKQGR